MGLIEGFLLLAYILGTGFGFWWGAGKGHRDGIVDTIDSLIEQDYLKFRGSKSNPDIIKWNEKH